MPNFYCEYCGIYLKHSSPFGRKQHSTGKKHIFNKMEYYRQFLMEYQQQGSQIQGGLLRGKPPMMQNERQQAPPQMTMRPP